MTGEETGDIENVIDTSVQLVLRADIIDPNQQGLFSTGTLRVLVLVLGAEVGVKVLRLLRNGHWLRGRTG